MRLWEQVENERRERERPLLDFYKGINARKLTVAIQIARCPPCPPTARKSSAVSNAAAKPAI